MKTLKDIAGLYKTLAEANLVSGPTRAYKTGNLLNQVSSRNNANSMISTPSKGVYVISLNYSPEGATYGKFVEEGTRYMDARPFAENAANSPELKRAIDNFVMGKVDELLVEWQSKMNNKMSNAGFVVS